MKKLSLLLSPALLISSMALAAVPSKPMNDQQVAKIVTTVNDGEIALANHVLSSTKNESVKKFAQHMIHDHKLNNSATRDIVAKEKITPMESEKSLELKTKGENSRARLMNLTGAELDKAYIDDQVKMHQTVLNDIKTNLIPAAEDSMLKAHLEKTAKKVEQHLEEAKSIQGRL